MFLLDTNVVSHILRGDRPGIREQLVATPMSALAISSVTEAELRFGLAKRNHPSVLTAKVQEFLRRIDTLPWDSSVATAYGDLRAWAELRGKSIAPLDLMIAAHAIATDRTLVTVDKAFNQLRPRLKCASW